MAYLLAGILQKQNTFPHTIESSYIAIQLALIVVKIKVSNESERFYEFFQRTQYE